MSIDLAAQLRPPPPVPSPIHGRLAPSTPHLVSSSTRCTSTAASAHSAALSTSVARSSSTLAPRVEPSSALAAHSPSSSSSPPLLAPTESDWFRFPTPTRTAALSGAPMVDVVARLEQRGRKKGAGGLGRREWKMLGEWRVGESLGKGTSGHVRLGRSVRTGEFAAIKKVKRLPASDKHANSIHREISLMKLVAPHPHLVELLDVFETPTHLYLITEYCPSGELFHLIVKRALSPIEIHTFYTQLVSALTHLERSGISHRDVKFENLLLVEDEPGELGVKLSDMGMATFQEEGSLLRTSCGSPHYAAPEVIRADRYDGHLADVWSAGVVLYTMFARRLPFDDENIPTLLDKIKHRELEMHESVPHGLARDLVRRSLCKDPKKRIKLAEIVKHPYLRPLPYAPEPLTLEAIHPPQPADPDKIDFGGELDDGVLESLVVVLKVKDVEMVREMLEKNHGRARLFYAILLSFRQPRQPRTPRQPQYAASIHLSTDSLPDSIQPEDGASLRRSMSAPDMSAFPVPPHELDVETTSPPPEAPPPTAVFVPLVDATPVINRRRTSGDLADKFFSARTSVDSMTETATASHHRYSQINQSYAFPGPPPPAGALPPLPSSNPPPQTVTSAPPHIESFPAVTPPFSPLAADFLASIRPPGTRSKRGSVRPSTAGTSATRSMPVSPKLEQDPTFGSGGGVEKSAEPTAHRRPSIDVGEVSRRLSTLSLFRAPSKKTSMQQRLRSLFHGGGNGGGANGGGSKRSSVVSVQEEASISTAAKVSVPTIRPPSPAPSSKSSMLKRSSAYRSFGRALDGLPPKSPELTEFGELLSLGASASEAARAAHSALPAVEEDRGRDKVVKKPAPLVGRKPSPAPPGFEFFHDPPKLVEPASSSTKQARKQRPLPLKIESSNVSSTPLASPGLAAPKPMRKPPSLLGLGRPSRRLVPKAVTRQPSPLSLPPSVVVDSVPPSPSSRPVPQTTSPDESDAEDPSALISALKQYPYRSATSTLAGSIRSPGSTCSSVFPSSSGIDGSRAHSALSMRRASYSTANTTFLSARSPRIGEDDDDPSDELAASVSRLRHSPALSGYSSSYAASLRRQRDLEAELRRVQVENRLLAAAVESKDDQLELLRRSERRLTRCVQNGEMAMLELSQQRDELEDFVRALDWRGGGGRAGGGNSFFDDLNEETADEYGLTDGDDEDDEERTQRLMERKVREDEWLQSLRAR
ncbi:hypothetical protein JCM8097_001598 [Rhodosporidiobolus ruineniae]